jgi:FtsX-like permease family
VAVGAAMTKAGLEHIPAEASADIQQVFAEESKLDTILRVAPGVDRMRTVGQLNKEDLVSYFADELPGDIRNLDLVRAYPLWLAGFLAAIGLFTVGNALVVSARKRSQQVGILRALGLTRGQIVGAVSSQGATMCVVGALIGVPLGIALGRWTWAASARQLGVGEGLGAPMLALLALVLFAVVLLGLLGATAGWFAGRATPSDALRVP